MALTVSANTPATAAAFNQTLPVFVTKGVTQTVTSSVALVDDDELFLDLAAGRTYKVELVLSLPTGAIAGDIRTAWSTTGTITQVTIRSILAPATTVTDNAIASMRSTAHGLTTEIISGITASGNTGALYEHLIVTCTVAGRLQFRWAQGTSNATATTVGSLSYLLAHPIA